MNRLLVFGLGVLVGAGAAAYGPSLARELRPLIKEAIKAAMQIGHGAQVKGTGLVEMLEDVYAEALAEAGVAASAAKPRAPKRQRAKTTRRTARRRPVRAKASEAVAEHA